MRVKPTFLILFLALSVTGFAQGPDFSMDELYHVTGTQIVEPEKKFSVSSALKVYSDGKFLSLAIKVIDPSVNNDPDPNFADRVDVWLALPESAYPKSFPYSFHPRILKAPVIGNRGYEQVPDRLFTIDEAYTRRLSLRNFLENHDYPASKDIYRRNLRLPEARDFEESIIPYGIVQFSLFRDRRNAILFNEYALRSLEDHMGRRMGPLADWLEYTADITESEDGYIINVDFSPEAMGFVTLPYLEGINLMVDVLDAPKGGKARVVNSTSQTRSVHPVSFQYVSFGKPLETNYTDLSDELFLEADFRPIVWFTENDWDGFGIDVDGLVIDRKTVSDELLEVKLYEESLYANKLQVGEYEVDVAQVALEYVNQVPAEKEYIWANGHSIVAERARVYGKYPVTEIEDRWFTYGDGTLGLIYRESIPKHIFGWGDCGTCLIETINISRLAEAEMWDILEIVQEKGPDLSCKIGNEEYSNFYVSKFDWVEEGSTLVLRLYHQNTKEKKRIQVSWDEFGTNLEIEELDR